jgi:uncharacterized membrane protein YgdD (TMEM256/DUF423 family)
MNKKIVISGAVLIVISIILGAFAAHGLKTVIGAEEILIFEKGVKYEMYTGLGLLIVGLGADKLPFNLKWFHRLSMMGVIIFSGFIYFLAFKELNPSFKILGAIVPIGGTLMIAAWISLLINLFKKS